MKRTISLLAAIALSMSMMAGCDGEEEISGSAPPDESPSVHANADTPPEPENSERPDDSDEDMALPRVYDWSNQRESNAILRFSLEGMEQEVPAELVPISMYEFDGPELSLYIDSETFNLSDSNGFYRFSTSDGFAFFEIGFMKDANADFEAPAFLEDFDRITLLSDENLSYIGDESYTARHIEAEGDNGLWTAYLIQRGDDVITIAVHRPNSTESADAYTRMTAMLGTLMIRDFEE